MIKKFFSQVFHCVEYFLKADIFHYHKFPLLNAFEGKKAYVLVNGPSLKKALDEYDEGIHHFDENSFMVNLSALDPRFLKIRPKHYCLSDPMFYQDYLPKKDAIREMYDILNTKVDWDMYLYFCFSNKWEYKKIIEYAKITNPHIKIVFMNRKHCSKLVPPLRHWLYKKGWFMPEDGTIANTAIYLALIEGYKEIELYGADHNMFLEFAVNDNNELCSYDAHFYDKGDPQMKVFKNTCSSEDIAWRVHQYMYVLYIIFYSHDLLRQFANYMGARVLNCTPGSMIDSYERIKTELNGNE